MKRWKLAVILAASMTMAAACSSPQALVTDEQAAAAAKKVKTASAAVVSMGVPVKAAGSVIPSARIDMSAEIGGKLTKRQVQVGDAVKQGDLLLELDPTELQSALERAKLAKERVLVELDNSRVQLRDENNNTVQLLQISLKEAELAIQEASRSLQKTKLVSPISGIVTEVQELTAGQQIAPGQKLIQIEQMDPLYVEAVITEQDSLDIGGREELAVYFPVLEETVGAAVQYVSPSASGQAGGFQLKLKLANNEGRLRPGMSAQVILDDDKAKGTLAVPVAAVLSEEGSSYVYKVDSAAKAVKTKVEIGRTNKDHAEVISGLAEGDSVVIVGQSLLSDGDNVEVVE